MNRNNLRRKILTGLWFTIFALNSVYHVGSFFNKMESLQYVITKNNLLSIDDSGLTKLEQFTTSYNIMYPMKDLDILLHRIEKRFKKEERKLKQILQELMVCQFQIEAEVPLVEYYDKIERNIDHIKLKLDKDVSLESQDRMMDALSTANSIIRGKEIFTIMMFLVWDSTSFVFFYSTAKSEQGVEDFKWGARFISILKNVLNLKAKLFIYFMLESYTQLELNPERTKLFMDGAISTLIFFIQLVYYCYNNKNYLKLSTKYYKKKSSSIQKKDKKALTYQIWNSPNGFHHACLYGLTTTVKECLKNDSLDTDAPDFIFGYSGLYLACLTGRMSIVQKLIDLKKASPSNVNGESQNTPLMAASSGGHLSIIKKLLRANGVDILRRNVEGKTATCLAFENGYYDSFFVLLSEERKKRQKDSAIDIYSRKLYSCIRQESRQNEVSAYKTTIWNLLKEEASPSIPSSDQLLQPKKDMLTLIGEHWECPICMESMAPPKKIYTCPNDHWICSDCFGEFTISTKCPSCRANYGSIRRVFNAEKVAALIFNNKEHNIK